VAGMKTARRRRLAGALCAVAAIAAAAAVGACGSDDDDGSSSPEPGDSQAIGRAMKETIPAEIDERPHSFVSASLLHPVTNAWRTSSHKRLTEVDAGALAANRSTGAFAIFRHDFLRASQDVTVVEVKDSGPLRISRAPLGPKVEESAQRNGEIAFVGARGVRGELHLSDDSVSLRKP
jgi:hypothetical protein